MKIFTLSFLFVLAGFALMAQDTIPNAGFEFWTQGGPAYADPNGWQTLNSQTGLISVYTCSLDSATAHEGTRSVKLVTKTGAGFIIPGILSTGAIHQDGTIDHGIPISSRPLYLNGWYQYTPVANDTATFSITLFKAGADIGDGAFNTTDNVSAWTYFSVPVNYTTSDVPDSVQLLFFSGTDQASHVGSVLLLDDLSYSYTSGIAETAANPISLYPNPANSQINISNQNMNAASLNLYSVDGRMVKFITMHPGTNTVDVSALPAGFYVLAGIGANGNAYRSQLVIDK